MKNSIIIILIIIIVVAWGIIYLYRDMIKSKLDTTAGKVKADVSHAVKEIKEDIKS